MNSERQNQTLEQIKEPMGGPEECMEVMPSIRGDSFTELNHIDDGREHSATPIKTLIYQMLITYHLSQKL